MKTFLRATLLTGLGALLAAGPADPPPLDLSRDRALFVVNYSHLDTQWRWAYPLVVREMLRNTLYDNFREMEAHPDYVFNWTGAGRYQLLKEYYPREFRMLKGYVAKGQWFPSGNAWEESDVNVPSSESLIRQLLVGHRFFKREFGLESFDYMLPDCFGFPASLPSILAHCGIKGFSTGKLTWGSAVGVPFNLGRWEGPDGRSVVAALNPGAYDAHLTAPLDGEPWVKRLDENGRRGGIRADLIYNGTGDEGGAPFEDSLRTLRAAMGARGPVKVVAARADALYNAITPDQKAGLQGYRGDLLLTEHSAGSLTSQAFLKRLNRGNELLAGAAETAASAARLLGAGPYPHDTLEKAWGLTLRDQFHDILPGTCLPKSYEYAWNDGFIAAKAFQGALEDAVGAVARGLDTRVDGVPLVIYNPLGIDREDVVEVQVPDSLAGSPALTAVDPSGKALPTQEVAGEGGRRRVIFLAKAPSLGFAVYGLRAGRAPEGAGPSVSGRTLENGRYRVTLDEAGDLAGIRDLRQGRELLAAPGRLVFQQEKPRAWPAWNMDWADRQKAPRAYVDGPARIQVLERGPVRVAIRVEREGEGSRFQQVYRLSAGAAGDRVEVVNSVDWKSSECSLKATFPLAAANPLATYSWDLGTVQRGNNDPRKYEVPTHGWMDLGTPGGEYGVSLLTGAKYGSDKPDDHTLRLTLLYTPGVRSSYREQRWQDWGRHSFTYGIAGHSGDWRRAGTPWLAQRQDQPLRAFQVPSHGGPLGRTYSLLRVSSPQVAVQALKRAEDGEGLVVRLQELHGKPAKGVALSVAGTLLQARELDGLERPLGPVSVSKGRLALDFTPCQVRTLGLEVRSGTRVEAPAATPLDLPWDVQAFTTDDHREDGSMDGAFTGYPAEMLPDTLEAGGVSFRLGPREPGRANAVACRGQVLQLPAGTRGVHLLVAGTQGDLEAAFQAGEQTLPVTAPAWTGYLGSWDNRVFKGEVPEPTYSVDNDLERVAPAFLRPGRPAWWASHHHAKGRDQVYDSCYLFAVRVEVPAGQRTLTLPRDPRVRVFAATAASVDNAQARPLQPLFPDLARDPAFAARFAKP
jgi:alpha-mannosidase